MVKQTNPRKNNSSRSIGMIVLLIIVVVLISSLVTVLVFKGVNPKPYEIERLPYDFKVTNAISFVLDDDILHFGGGPAGARLRRGMNVTTSKDALLKISWSGDGNIFLSENNFFITANESKSLMFYLDIPPDLEEGSYSGELVFEFYR